MTPAGLVRLQADEGLRLHAYQDTVGRWTIGYGYAGPEVREGLVWDLPTAQKMLLSCVFRADQHLNSALFWYAGLDPVRRDVLVNIGYNVGVPALLTWTNTLAAFRAKDWGLAHELLLTEGKWNTQVGDRAKRLAQAVLTGSWA